VHKLCVGTMDFSSSDRDRCAQNEVILQESYIAETINISGAEVNVYKLMGVHQQDSSSVLPSGEIFVSPSPGNPATNINVLPWQGYEVGAAAVNNTYVGVDFGFRSGYGPKKAKLIDVGAAIITQSATPGQYATALKVEIADGTCVIKSILGTGNVGNGSLIDVSVGVNAIPTIVYATALSATQFEVTIDVPGASEPVVLGTATVSEIDSNSGPSIMFRSELINFAIAQGSMPFVVGDLFMIEVVYVWKRAGVFKVKQSPQQQVLNLNRTLKAKAIRVTPAEMPAGSVWVVNKFDALASPAPDISGIQDLFYGENRDRDYSIVPVKMKVQYTAGGGSTDLGKFGLAMLDQYTFQLSFSDMVQKLSRPIVIGDIIEVIPELQWDQNLRPVRKFLEVTDHGWHEAGFTPSNVPTVYRVNAQIALPSQETKDIFGTIDTEKYMTPDRILTTELGDQINTVPLTVTEEIIKLAADMVPEVGSDDEIAVQAVPYKQPAPPVNAKGQVTAPPNNPPPVAPVLWADTPQTPAKPSMFIEDGLPPNDEPYTEGYQLPEATAATDGDYFRLNYPPQYGIGARLYRFSALKGRWIFQQQDRRPSQSSLKPSVRAIMASADKQTITKKL